jgi:colicin import membrane protein
VEKLLGLYVLPPGLEGQLKTVLLVDLGDKGEVKKVAVKKSSGNEHHDHAAVAAILKASPLPLPTKENVRAQFKQFDITVSPKVLEGR